MEGVNLIDGPLPPEERGRPLTRVSTAEGIYEIRRTSAATFVARMPSGKAVPAGKAVYRADHILEGYFPTVPPAPAHLLARTAEIFASRPEEECIVCVYYDSRDGSHHLVWPEFSATRGSVDYQPPLQTEEVFCIAEIHSHNTFEAFFSETDNYYEVRTGAYGVIGRVDLGRPHAAFRYSCGGIFRPLPAGRIFTPASAVETIVEEVGRGGPTQRPRKAREGH
jgi:PRTRC genetic system protein A